MLLVPGQDIQRDMISSQKQEQETKRDALPWPVGCGRLVGRSPSFKGAALLRNNGGIEWGMSVMDGVMGGRGMRFAS